MFWERRERFWERKRGQEGFGKDRKGLGRTGRDFERREWFQERGSEERRFGRFYWENLTSSVLRLRIFTVKVIYFLKYRSPPARTFRHNHKTEKSAQADSLPHQSKKVRPGGLSATTKTEVRAGGLSATTTKAKKSACADFPPQPPK